MRPSEEVLNFFRAHPATELRNSDIRKALPHLTSKQVSNTLQVLVNSYGPGSFGIAHTSYNVYIYQPENNTRLGKQPRPKRQGVLTVQVYREVADPLTEAWLEERRHGDARISLTAFTSRIVELGLAASKQKGK